MAKKKSRNPNPPKPAEFRTTPFSALKGVAVASQQRKTTPPKPVTAPLKPADDDTELFLRAMDDVARLDKRASSPKRSAQLATPDKTVPEYQRTRERIDHETFAQAISQLKLDVTFRDKTPEDDEIKPLDANRLRQMKRGIVSVDRQLDLHGLTREEALEALSRFLESAAAHGEKAVLVITGKGNNSPGEPVLQQAVTAWLRDAGKKLVAEFAPAPREMGGGGAFVLFLKN